MPVITSASELAQAVKTPGSYSLAPGDYAPVKNGVRPITNLNNARGVTLESADPSNPAKLGGISAFNCQGLKLRGLVISGTGPYGIDLRDSSEVEIASCDIIGFDRAIGPRECTDLTVSHNRMSGQRIDAMQLRGCEDVTIEFNYLTDFHPTSGEHPDAIQVFVDRNNPITQRNFVIKGNCINIGTGARRMADHNQHNGSRSHAQGIFGQDDSGNHPFENFEITDNELIGTMFHAITLYVGKQIKVTGNKVWWVGQKCWIMTPAGTTLSGNSAPQYNTGGPAPAGNTLTGQITEAQGEQKALAWLAANPVGPGSLGAPQPSVEPPLPVPVPTPTPTPTPAPVPTPEPPKPVPPKPAPPPPEDDGDDRDGRGRHGRRGGRRR